MDYRVLEYLLYLPISVVLTVWVARTLYRHGQPFLVDVFPGNADLAGAVNHLLVVGFYLINLGYVSLQLKLETAPGDPAGLIEALAMKVGLVLIVLGVLHFGNLYVFARIRERARHPRRDGPTPEPPLPPLPPHAAPAHGAPWQAA